MEPFATKEQMEQRSQGAIPASTPFLDDELKAASRIIRNYCRWHIAPVQDDLEYAKQSRFREEIWLPAMQVQALAAVQIDGAAVANVSAVEFDRSTGWVGARGNMVAVTYSAGFEEVPDDIVALTLQIAARALGSPLGIVREQAGGVSVSYTQTGANTAGGSVLLPHEMEQLDAYRIGWMP